MGVDNMGIVMVVWNSMFAIEIRSLLDTNNSPNK